MKDILFSASTKLQTTPPSTELVGLPQTTPERINAFHKEQDKWNPLIDLIVQMGTVAKEIRTAKEKQQDLLKDSIEKLKTLKERTRQRAKQYQKKLKFEQTKTSDIRAKLERKKVELEEAEKKLTRVLDQLRGKSFDETEKDDEEELAAPVRTDPDKREEDEGEEDEGEEDVVSTKFREVINSIDQLITAVQETTEATEEQNIERIVKTLGIVQETARQEALHYEEEIYGEQAKQREAVDELESKEGELTDMEKELTRVLSPSFSLPDRTAGSRNPTADVPVAGDREGV